MFKRTANSMQLNTRTGNHSTKGSAKGFVDGLGVNAATVLSESERKESRRRAIGAQILKLSAELAQQKQVSNALLRQGNIGGHQASIVKANLLRASISELRAEVTMLNPGARRLPSSLIERAFVDICKETMTKAQFDLMMRQAKDRVRSNDDATQTDKE